MEAVRDMCAENKCQAFNRNWTCPPACGTLEECTRRIRRYQKGLLLQTVAYLERRIDYNKMLAAGEAHSAHFRKFCQEVRKEYPQALCLGAGGCRVCEHCAYPDPCRFPDQAYSSMEGYGLFVTQVCKDNDMPYYYGEKSIAYTACVLLY